MKLRIEKTQYLTLIYFLFLWILTIKFYKVITCLYAKESWGITEWLINYQGGFVRRGLLGEVIYNLHNYIGLSPYYTIVTSCVIAYLVLIAFFVKSFLKNGYSLFILPFVFFLGGPIINGFWLRKDVLIILIFISLIHYALKKTKISIFVTNLIFIIGLLIHEAIGFFAFPVLLLIIYNINKTDYQKNRFKSLIICVVGLFPSIVTFLMCLYNKGTLEISNAIWNSWKPIAFPYQTINNFGIPPEINNYQIPAAINGLSWSFKQGISLTIETFKNFNEGIYAPIAWFLLLLMIYFVLSNIERTQVWFKSGKAKNPLDKVSISNVLIFQFITILPLFILGWDYGRWVFLWVTSSFAIIILVPTKELSLIFPYCITATSLKINHILDTVFGKSREIVFLIAILIGVPACSLVFNSYFNTNALVIVLQYISNLISYMLFFIVKNIF